MHSPQARAAMPAMGNLVGRWLNEWLLVRQLGQGGMGAVYLAQGTDDRLVAIKVLHPSLAADAALVERFHAEARAASRIGHPSIVAVRDLGHAPPDLHYLVMEYLSGRSLTKALEDGAMAPARVCELVSQMLAGLSAAHVRGVVHRDLKPDNLQLVTDPQGREQLKILDFGVAKVLGGPGSGQTVAGTLVGTPEYMAPEQVAGDQVDARADLYAVGIIAYRLLTGVLPFTGPTVLAVLMSHQQDVPASPSSINPLVPQAVSDVVMRALAKKPEGRFSSADEMRQEWLSAFRARRASSVNLPALGRLGANPASSPGTPPPATSAATPTPRPPPRAERPALRTLFTVRLSPPGRGALRLPCVQVSSGGLLLEDPGPALPSRWRGEAELELPGGSTPVTLEVVGHVTAQQAREWGTAPGHWVQPVKASDEVRALLMACARGLTPPPASATPAVGDDPGIDRLVRSYGDGRQDDPYGFLQLRNGAPMPEIRRRVREIESVLEAPLGRRLSPRQRQELEKAQARVREAAARLLQPGSRARLDAERGDLAGVAQAIRAGISVTELAAARDEYLSRHAGGASRSRIHEVTARAWEARGRFSEALEELERALKADPLNLGLHKAYWPLRRKVFPDLDESAV